MGNDLKHSETLLLIFLFLSKTNLLTNRSHFCKILSDVAQCAIYLFPMQTTLTALLT